MSGRLSFSIQVTYDHLENLVEIQERAKDLRPLFDQIMTEWARDNKDKFDLAKGMELGGAQIDQNVFWAALRPTTMRTKRRLGQPDNIMVATGKLRSALTNPEGFFRLSDEQRAIFGTPNDPDDAMKVMFNWTKRQVIFLSLDDMRMIRALTQQYFGLGGLFKQMRFAQGMTAVQREQEVARLDAEFADIASGG